MLDQHWGPAKALPMEHSYSWVQARVNHSARVSAHLRCSPRDGSRCADWAGSRRAPRASQAVGPSIFPRPPTPLPPTPPPHTPASPLCRRRCRPSSEYTRTRRPRWAQAPPCTRSPPYCRRPRAPPRPCTACWCASAQTTARHCRTTRGGPRPCRLPACRPCRCRCLRAPCIRHRPVPTTKHDSQPQSCNPTVCRADKSAVATVSETKELKKRSGAKRESPRPFWKPSPMRASLQREVSSKDNQIGFGAWGGRTCRCRSRRW